MRVPRRELPVQPDLGQQVTDPRGGRRRGTRRCAASGSRIEVPTRIRGSRLLSGSWNTICAARRKSCSARAAQRGDVGALEPDLPPADRTEQPDHGPADGGLARAALADQAEAERPGRHLQADPIDRPHRPEPHAQVIDLQQRGHPGTSPSAGAGGAGRHGRGLARTEPGHRGQQLGRVLVPRRGQHLANRALLDDAAALHDGHPVAQFGHHSQVVADQQHRHALPLAQAAEQVEHLGLHRHVQRAGRLVGQQHLGPQRQRERDRHPLQLPAGQLRRVPVQQVRRQQHLPHRPRRRVRRVRPAHPVQPQRAQHHAAHLEYRAERQCRALEDGRDPPSADVTQLHAATARSARRRPAGCCR